MTRQPRYLAMYRLPSTSPIFARLKSRGRRDSVEVNFPAQANSRLERGTQRDRWVEALFCSTIVKFNENRRRVLDMNRKVVMFLATLLILESFGYSQNRRKANNSEEGCRRFVQAFYDTFRLHYRNFVGDFFD
jgi:hypothetical protein